MRASPTRICWMLCYRLVGFCAVVHSVRELSLVPSPDVMRKELGDEFAHDYLGAVRITVVIFMRWIILFMFACPAAQTARGHVSEHDLKSLKASKPASDGKEKKLSGSKKARTGVDQYG